MNINYKYIVAVLKRKKSEQDAEKALETALKQEKLLSEKSVGK